jgi:hypothetical protein
MEFANSIEPAHLRKKSEHGFRVIRKRSAQDLDCDLTVELCVAGAPDFAHPAHAEFRHDAVMREVGVHSQRFAHRFDGLLRQVHAL